MKTLVLLTSLAATAAFGQYKLESAGAPPAELSPAIRDALEKDGHKVVGPNGVYAEIWLRAQPPKGANGESTVSFTDIPHGALMGAIRFPGKGTDRRGQAIAPVLYTLRLSFYPADGAHQGIAATRDFLLMTPATADQDLNAAPDYKHLIEMSKKASGTNHPAVLNAWKADSAGPVSLKQEGEDWVLNATVGNEPIALIVVGTYAG